MWNIQLFKLNYDEAEVQAVKDVVESGWLTMGERVQAFENQFAAALGGNDLKCLAVTNCTAALFMAVRSVGLSAGDEVIISGLTFVADANAVVFNGATPIIADCKSHDDLTVDPTDIERKITPRTKAVIVVHYAGYSCDMDEIVSLCETKGITVIEDVAHAPGASYKGRPLGSIGDIGCFSFFSNKNLSIGEGGMLSFREPATEQRLRNLRSHGMSTLTLERHKGRANTYDVNEPGMNFRMDEIHAALGIVQLSKLKSGNARRRELTALYRRQFEGSNICMPFSKADLQESACHILPVLLPKAADRTTVMNKMRESGIQTSIHYPAFWTFTAYQHFDPQQTPVISEITDQQLTLPLFPGMTDKEVVDVTDALKTITA